MWNFDDEKAKKKGKLDIHVKKGALHKQLGVAEGTKLTTAQLDAAKAKGGLEAKRAQFAINARKWKH